MANEVQEKERQIRTKRIELRYYGSLIALVLTSLILVTVLIWAKVDNAIKRFEQDGDKTRQLICGVVDSFPDIPKNEDCEIIKRNAKSKPQTSKADKPSFTSSETPRPLVIRTVQKIPTTQMVVAPPQPKPTISVSTPEIITRINSKTKQLECQYVGDTLWQMGNCK